MGFPRSMLSKTPEGVRGMPAIWNRSLWNQLIFLLNSIYLLVYLPAYLRGASSDSCESQG